MVELRQVNEILEISEKIVAEYIGAQHAIICSSARNALQFSLIALGIGHSDEVVIPDFSCEILPITVFCTGARPRFCDVDKRTCAITSTSLKKVLGPQTKAVILIHPFGIPVETSEITEITHEKGIILIDDAAQSLGASLHNRMTGSLGDVGLLSFKKFLNCNLGGAAITNNEKLANKIRLIRAKKERATLFPRSAYRLMETLRVKSKRNIKRFLWVENKIVPLKWKLAKHRRIANSWATIDSSVLALWRSNALTPVVIEQLMTYARTYWHRRRMEDTELLLLNSELMNVEKYLRDRRRIVKKYDELLNEKGFDKIPTLKDSKPSYLRYPILVHDKSRVQRAIKELHLIGFNVEDYRYKPLHKSPNFGFLNNNADFPNSLYISERILPLPIIPGMDHEKIEQIAHIINAPKPVIHLIARQPQDK